MFTRYCIKIDKISILYNIELKVAATLLVGKKNRVLKTEAAF